VFRPVVSGLARASWPVLLVALVSPVLADEPPVDDPMRPYRPGAAAQSTDPASRAVVLTAVLIAANRRVAVINGRLYREGEDVAGARITRIDSHSVQLTRSGETRVVALSTGPARVIRNNGDTSQ